MGVWECGSLCEKRNEHGELNFFYTHTPKYSDTPHTRIYGIHQTAYQKMIRNLLDSYAVQHMK